MKTKIIGIFVCTFFIASSFAIAIDNDSNNLGEGNKTIEDDAINFDELEDMIPIVNGGWHPEEELTKHGNEYYLKDDNWQPYSSHAMRALGGSGDGYIYYKFDIEDTCVKEGSLEIGVEFCSWSSWPWIGGPDLWVYNFNSYQWIRREQSMGNQDEIIWKWYMMSNSNDWVDNNGDVEFCVYDVTDDDAIVDDVGVRFQAANEELYQFNSILRDDYHNDSFPDGIDYYFDVDVGDNGDGTTVEVTMDAELWYVPGPTLIDTDTDTWTIIDWETEFGHVNLTAQGGENGIYQAKFYLYDEYGNPEGSYNTSEYELFPNPVNNPPYMPSEPIPENGTIGVPVDTNLSWTGGDPDPDDNVTYDVYFGTSSPPPLVDTVSVESYDPGKLPYETTHFWKIVAWDNHGASTVGPEWSFTTKTPEPNLDCDGDLDWVDVEPGATVEGIFYVVNVGDVGSELDWTVIEYPGWGTWTFTPMSGNDLKPEDGIFTIEVEVIAPNQQETEFDGEVKIANIHNISDNCTIDASLVTPVNQISIRSSSNLFQFIQSRIFNFDILERK